MKFIFILLFFIGLSVCQAEELKVLMIGNSFSNSVMVFLPKIVQSSPDCQLKLANLFIGGCTLERHCREYDKSEKNPEHKPYSTRYYGKNQKVSMQDLLKAETWDIITVQQGSHQSWRPECYTPFADKLIGIIRKYQPDAEIVVHQTWSYRADDPRLIASTKYSWGFDQKGMYERLDQCYTGFAAKYGFRIIPVGYAVQLTREKSPEKFTGYDPEMLKKLQSPALPPPAPDVVGSCHWIKKRKTGEKQLSWDRIHLNQRGEYLQGCIWFMFLFRKKAADVKFIPKEIESKDAAFLSRCAEEAVVLYPQTKKK